MTQCGVMLIGSSERSDLRTEPKSMRIRTSYIKRAKNGPQSIVYAFLYTIGNIVSSSLDTHINRFPAKESPGLYAIVLKLRRFVYPDNRAEVNAPILTGIPLCSKDEKNKKKNEQKREKTKIKKKTEKTK